MTGGFAHEANALPDTFPSEDPVVGCAACSCEDAAVRVARRTNLDPLVVRTPTTSQMVAKVLIALIRIYQWTLSPLLGPSCRFEPSCSRYAIECLRLHGAAKGSYLAVRRILRCHPFHPGGYDPPPLPKDSGARRPAMPLPNSE